jgi:hypothetical protein
MAVVVITFHGRFLDRTVHSLDLAIGLGMLDFGEPVLDPIDGGNHLEQSYECNGCC